MLALTAMAVAGPANADALALYRLGEYASAIQEAEAQNTAASLALAAQARLAMVDLGQSTGKKKALKAALKNANAALKLAPDNAHAHLMKAATLGFRSRGRSKFSNYTKGTARKSLKHIKAALALQRESPRAHAILGVWNLEIIRRAGKTGARITGASTEEGLKACQFAIAHAPDDAAIGVQCGLSLLVLKAPKMQAHGLATLQAAANNNSSTTAFERAMRVRAREILAINTDDGIQVAQNRALVYLSFEHE